MENKANRRAWLSFQVWAQPHLVRTRSDARPGPAFSTLDAVTGNAGVRPGAGGHARWQGGGHTDVSPSLHARYRHHLVSATTSSLELYRDALQPRSIFRDLRNHDRRAVTHAVLQL